MMWLSRIVHRNLNASLALRYHNDFTSYINTRSIRSFAESTTISNRYLIRPLSVELFACNISHEPPLREAPEGAVTNPLEGDAGDHSGFISKELDSLSSDESLMLCQKARQITDPCTALSFNTDSVQECQQNTRSCRKQTETTELYGPCSSVRFRENGDCPVAADAYLDCIEAFEKKRICENVGKIIVTPPECYDVVEHCEDLAQSFGRTPQDVPVCDDSQNEKGDLEHDKDIYGAEGCFPRPARMVVLGDSLSKCISYIEPIDDCACAWKRLASYIRSNYAPDLVVEGCYPEDEIRGNIRDVAQDAQMILGGPGHILVYISSIGLDLLDFRGESDAIEDLEKAITRWSADWQKLYDTFTDENRFPDGATFLLNTLYSPTDDCPLSEKDTVFTTLTEREETIVRHANERVLLDVARTREDTVAVDMYPDWLGHGHNFDVSTCPHYSPDKTWWMSDQMHPNNEGYRHMGGKWKRAVDRMFGENCK